MAYCFAFIYIYVCVCVCVLNFDRGSVDMIQEWKGSVSKRNLETLVYTKLRRLVKCKENSSPKE
jgi:hypothetical protein